jgi:hypothetical protein
MTTKKQKVMSIINICNVIKPSNKEDVEYWIEKIKELCEEMLK